MKNFGNKSQGHSEAQATSKDESYPMQMQKGSPNPQKITLQLGSITSTFMTDGSWRPAARDSKKQTRLELKSKHDKLCEENEKLNLKHEVLLELADATLVEHMAVKQELKQLRRVFKKFHIDHGQQKGRRGK